MRHYSILLPAWCYGVFVVHLITISSDDVLAALNLSNLVMFTLQGNESNYSSEHECCYNHIRHVSHDTSRA